MKVICSKGVCQSKTQSDLALIYQKDGVSRYNISTDFSTDYTNYFFCNLKVIKDCIL